MVRAPGDPGPDVSRHRDADRRRAAVGSTTLLTEVDTPNPDPALASGDHRGTAHSRKTPSYRISADAVIFNAGGTQVAVVENGVAHLRKIGVLRDLGSSVEVDTGVLAGYLSSSIRQSISPTVPTSMQSQRQPCRSPQGSDRPGSAFDGPCHRRGAWNITDSSFRPCDGEQTCSRPTPSRSR